MPIAREPRPASPLAFPVCFLAGLLMTLCALFGSVVVCAARTELFRDALTRSTVSGGAISQADADAFAEETIGYLTGERDAWLPRATVDGAALAVPETFVTHMATVRGWMLFAKTALPLAAATGFLLLTACAFAPGRRRGGGLSLGGYYAGAALPALIALGLGLWAAMDFNAFWAWLHMTFIPDGIFPAGEPIMRLFPETLFAGYAAPAGLLFAAFWAVALLLPPGLRRLSGGNGRKAAD